MAINPEQWKEKRAQREQQRKEREAKQRKMLIRIGIIVAALVVCAVLAIVVVNKFSPKPEEPTPTEPPVSQDVEAPAEDAEQTGEEQTEEQAEEGTVDSGKNNYTTIHVVAGGDVNITDKVVSAGGLGYDYTDVFMDVAYLFANADLSMVNLEGNLCGSPYGSSTRSAPPGLVSALDRAGIDLVQLANSYSINRGVSGLMQTISGVRAAGMEPLGVYQDAAEFRSSKGFTLYNVQGIEIAVVAFTKGMDGMALPAGSENCVNLLYNDYESTYQSINREGITKILSSVEQENPDITIALLHWGSEYNDTISPTQEDIVDLMLANGVDAIIGTHPHYVQQMIFDEEEGTFVAYSLGDLISDAERSGTQYSVLLDLEITKNLRNGKTSISGFSYTPIYTVAETGSPVRVVRINEAIQGYESYFIGRASQQIYEDMQYALQRIQARVNGE